MLSQLIMYNTNCTFDHDDIRIYPLTRCNDLSFSKLRIWLSFDLNFGAFRETDFNTLNVSSTGLRLSGSIKSFSSIFLDWLNVVVDPQLTMTKNTKNKVDKNANVSLYLVERRLNRTSRLFLFVWASWPCSSRIK